MIIPKVGQYWTVTGDNIYKTVSYDPDTDCWEMEWIENGHTYLTNSMPPFKNSPWRHLQYFTIDEEIKRWLQE